MAEGQADRAVLFRLQVVADGDNEQQFAALTAAFIETQKKAHQTAAEAAKTGAKLQFDAYAASYVQIREQAEKLGADARTMAQTTAQAATAASERQRSAAQAASTANQKASAEERTLANDALRVKRSLMTEQEKFNKRVWELTQHYAAGRLTVGEYAKAEEAAREKMVSALKRQEAAVDRVRRAEETARDRTNREIEKQERTATAAQESSRTHMRAAKASVSEVGEAILRAGRGFALLGVANEKTTEKIVQGLAKVQGAYDILKGGFEVWRKMTEAMEHYRKGLQATAAASKALTAAETMRAAAAARAAASGVASGATGSAVVGTAAGAAGAALGAKAAAGGAGAAGTGTAAVAGLGAKIGLGLAAAASSAVVITELWELFAGTSKRADSLTYKIAATEVAIVDWFGEVTGLFDLVGNQKTDKMEQVRAKMMEDAATVREQTAKEEGGRSLYESTSIQFQRALLERQFAAAGLKGPQLQAASAQGGYALARDQWEQATRERQALVSGLAERKSGSGESLSIREAAEWETRIAASTQRQAEAAQQAVAAAKERLAAEEQITQERLATIDKSIAGARAELSLREQAIEKERQAKLTAQERIAEMDEGQQRQLVSQLTSIRGKQARGDTVTAEEYRTLQQWSGLSEFERIKKEQTQLRAGPIWEALGLGRDEDRRIARARAGDFGDVLREHYRRPTADVEREKDAAIDERRRVQEEADATRKRITDEVYSIEQRQRLITMDSSRRSYDDAKAGLARLVSDDQQLAGTIQGQIGVLLRDERTLKVSVERDDAKLAKQVTADVERILTDRDQTLLAIIRQEISVRAKLRAGVVRQSVGGSSR